MPGRLQGKVAIVTGSSSGLGRAIALAYANEGAEICCADLYPTPRTPLSLPNTNTSSTTAAAAAAAAATGSGQRADSYHNRSTSSEPTHSILRSLYGHETAMFCNVDVTNAGSVEGLVRTCVEWKGRVDVLVCCAGVSVESTHEVVTRCHETSEQDWDLTLGVNAKGVFLCCKYALKQMLSQDLREEEVSKGELAHRGWIVNVASIQALVAYHGTPSYCASKGAVLQLTKQLAVDYARDRIHCNALCPGFLKTNMTQNLISSPSLYAATNAAHPFGGMGSVDSVAKAAVMLATEDVEWITGVGLVVDGGFSAL